MNPDLTYTAATKSHWSLVETWCVANIGAWNEQWYRVHADLADFINVNNSPTENYYFRTGEQATLFALRWS